jgi:DNA repair exonuclease SbcCD ATPase subunit
MAKSRKTITVDAELAELVDEKPSFNLSGFVNECLEQHFGGGGMSSPKNAALQAELERLERELADLDDKKEQIRQKRQSIEEELEEQAEQEPELMAQAKETLDDVPRDPSNAAIQNWASKLGITTDELLEKLPERKSETAGNYL